MRCLTCELETKNAKFCSRSCSARQTNKIPKRKLKVRICRKCHQSNDRNTHVICSKCVAERHEKKNRIGLLTLADVALRYARNGIAPSYRHSYVRGHCHQINDLPKRCQLCGYDTHVELCHVRGIATFPLTTTLNEVNDSTNIVVLCRNHHWELDHGVLRYENIPKR